MKRSKLLMSILFFLPLLSSCGGDSKSISISEADQNDFSLNYYEDRKGFIIEDYLGNETAIRLPSMATLNGIAAPVIGIGGYAFANRPVKEIHLSQSIQYIGEYAFFQSQIEKLVLTPYLQEIDSNAFINCSITFEEKDGVKFLPTEKGTYGYALGYDGKEDATITLPDECEAVYDDIFNGSQTINVGMNMRSFGSINGFCKYVLPSSLTEISAIRVGDNAFFGNKSLQNVTVLGNSNRIGEHAFSYSSVKSITVLDGVTSIANNAFFYCASLTSILLPDSVTSIEREAFGGCSSLTAITLPNNITEISDALFISCSSLASITIKGKVTSIGKQSFNRCSSLKSITLPDGLVSIGDYAFMDCSELESMDIPTSVASIGVSAFSDCVSLKSISIPEGVTSIGQSMFSNCIRLESISFPSTVTSIGSGAFYRCLSLKTIQIPTSITSIGEYAFLDCQLDSAFIPSSVMTMGASAFGSSYSAQRNPTTLYCEATSKPSGWNSNWCGFSCTVVWGYQGS